MGSIVILTGAGISAESGLGTFRDKGGLWEKFNPTVLANPRTFSIEPARVHEFYNLRRAKCIDAQPNEAHVALARLEREYPGQVLIVTQNVDDLHQRAGSVNVLQMHGALRRARCSSCGAKWQAALTMSPIDPCPICGAQSCRPDVVWFGESPYHMAEIRAAIAACDQFVVIGSSGSVYPAAGFAALAQQSGSQTLSINLDTPSSADTFDQLMTGPATRMVPRWVDLALNAA
jgi:NAD-dependent deacetylase